MIRWTRRTALIRGSIRATALSASTARDGYSTAELSSTAGRIPWRSAAFGSRDTRARAWLSCRSLVGRLATSFRMAAVILASARPAVPSVSAMSALVRHSMARMSYMCTADIYRVRGEALVMDGKRSRRQLPKPQLNSCIRKGHARLTNPFDQRSQKRRPGVG